MPIPPTDRPLPLEMNDGDAERVSLYVNSRDREPNERLLTLHGYRRTRRRMARVARTGRLHP